MSSSQAQVFEALIVPYRSLSRKGVVFVIIAVMGLSATVALRFLVLGAWPVVAFSLLEAPLLGVLLAINIRRARASELIMLNPRELVVIRTDSAGRRRRVSLPAAWLRVDLDARRESPRVVLSSHGRDCEVGAFLHEPDKRSLFEALSAAVYSVRNPRFDNPQLRDC
jgi:uncharacterized membrane protein